jgi:hypothetical protein
MSHWLAARYSMARRDWLPSDRSARRESDLRSYPFADRGVYLLECGTVIRRPRTAAATRQRRGSQGRKTPRGNRSGRFPASPCVGSLQVPGQPASSRHRHASVMRGFQRLSRHRRSDCRSTLPRCGAQAEDGESLLILHGLFLWDCWVIAQRGIYILYFSHDEWGQLFAEPTTLDRAREYLTQMGLIS